MAIVTLSFNDETHKLVPVEPTPQMVAVGRVNLEYASCTAAQLWSAMLAAAPDPTTAGVEGAKT